MSTTKKWSQRNSFQTWHSKLHLLDRNKIDEIKVTKIKNENHVDFSSSLFKQAEVESNNDKNELSIYCKFLSEQIFLVNTIFHETFYPENTQKIPSITQQQNQQEWNHEEKSFFHFATWKANFVRCELKICYSCRLIFQRRIHSASFQRFE